MPIDLSSQEAVERTIRDLHTRLQSAEATVTDLKDTNQQLAEANEAAERKHSLGDPLLTRYVDPRSGTAVLTRRSVGEKGKELYAVPGLLDDPEPANELQRDLQRLVDARTIARTIQAGMARAGNGRVHTPQLDEEIKRTIAKLPDALQRAFVDTAGSGGEWIPSNTVPELERAVSQVYERMLPGVIPVRDVERNITLPLLSNGFVPYLHGVTDDDPAKIKSSSVATSSMSTSLQTIAARAQIGQDAAEESLVPAMQDLREIMAYAIVSGLEDAILNGDTGTHMDTGLATWNPGGFWAAAPGGSSIDHRRAWIGLRANAVDNSNTVDRSTYSFATLLLDMANIAGPYDPSKLVLVGNKLGLAKNLYGLTEVKDLSVYGPAASIFTGSVREIAGIGSVFESQFMTADLTTAGIYDGTTTTKTGMVLFAPDRWRYFRRYGVQLGMELDITRGVWNLVGKTRGSLKPFVSTEKNVRYQYNVAKS
jgi:hypothetical protein